MNYLIASLNFTALTLILIRRGLPQPFPWLASALMGYVLLFSGLLSPYGGIERAIGFVTLLSSLIVTRELTRVFPSVRKALLVLSIIFVIFILADAFRIIPTPDISMTSGETFQLMRRPYLFEHPNVKAAWLLLMTLSPIALIGIIAAQSRGALLGYITALTVKIIPRRYYFIAALACIALMTAAAFVRPGTFFWRADIWREAVDLFNDHPLTGYGTGTYIQHTQTGMATAHNAALTIAAENGLIGLLAFAAWLIPLFVLVIRSKSNAKYNLIAFGVQQFVDDQWLHPITAILLGAVLAVCIFRNEPHAPPQ